MGIFPDLEIHNYDINHSKNLCFEFLARNLDTGNNFKYF